MSRQLAFSSSVSVMIMTMFALSTSVTATAAHRPALGPTVVAVTR